MGKKQISTDRSIVSILLKGLAVAVLITILTNMIAALLIVNGIWNEEMILYITAFTIAISAFGGSLLGLRKVGERRLIYSAIIGLAFFLLLMAVGMLVFEGTFQHVAVTALLSMGGSVAAGLVSFGGKTQHRNRKRKIKSATIVHVA